MPKEILKEKIIKATGCLIIKEEEPLLWRINPKWAEKITDKILKLLEKEKQKWLKKIEQILMDNITGNDLQTHKELNKVYEELEKLKKVSKIN